MLNNIIFYIHAMRLPTLAISVSLWWVACHLFYFHTSKWNFTFNFIILICMSLIQIAVNYFNDVLDFKRGKDTNQRQGPVRMVREGLIPPSHMMMASVFILILAGMIGVYLVLKGGLLILLIGGVGLLMTYGYSAPPFSLADRGLSEIFVFLFFGILAVLGIYHLNYFYSFTNTSLINSLYSPVSWFFVPLKYLSHIWIVGVQMGLLSLSVLIINHLRDYEEDKQTHKKNWVVRLGLKWGRVQWLVSILVPYLISIGGVLIWGLPIFYYFSFLSFPIHCYLILQIFSESSSKCYNAYLKTSVLAQLLFSLGLSIGLRF